MRRPQFTLRALLVAMLVVAVGAWGATLVGLGPVLALPVVLAVLWGISRRPLEGVLVCAFLLIVATWLGIFVFCAAMGGY